MIKEQSKPPPPKKTNIQVNNIKVRFRILGFPYFDGDNQRGSAEVFGHPRDKNGHKVTLLNESHETAHPST